MKVLIPILSKKENNEEFLRKALEKAKEVIVFLPVDSSGATTSGFPMSEIASGQKLMDEITAKVGRMRKRSDSLLEWGDPVKNIDHIARLRGIERIALVKQENEFFKQTVKALKGKKDYKLMVIDVPENSEPTKTN